MTFYLSIHKNLNKLCGQWVNINISSTHAEGNEFNTFAAILFKMNLRLLVYPLWDNESFVLFYSCGIFTAIFFVFPTFTFETPLFFRQFTAAAWTSQCEPALCWLFSGLMAPGLHPSISPSKALLHAALIIPPRRVCVFDVRNLGGAPPRSCLLFVVPKQRLNCVAIYWISAPPFLTRFPPQTCACSPSPSRAARTCVDAERVLAEICDGLAALFVRQQRHGSTVVSRPLRCAGCQPLLTCCGWPKIW